VFRKVQDWVNSLIVQVMVGTPSAFHSSLQLANRTRSLLLAVATLATFMVGFTPQAQAAPLQMDQSLSGKPNIVLVLMDDHGATGDYQDLQRLPNISSIFLDQGISFTNYLANFSLCCPGRAALYTGLRDDHNGVMGNNGAQLFDPRASIFTELQAQGYWTAGYGKWFNGTNTAAINRIRGMNAFAWKNHGQYYSYPIWIKNPTTGKITQAHYGNSPSDYSTDVVSQYAMQSLNAVPAGQPVFLDLAPNATHGGPDATGHKDHIQPVPDPKYVGDPRCQGIPPYDPASYNEANVSDKPAYVQKLHLLTSAEYKNGWPMEKNCEALLAVDDWLGQTVQWLTATGRINNTIFILTSDNGMGWGANRIEGKIAPYTVRMPLFITWPGVTPTTPTQNSTLLSNIDVAPTLCEIAGCTMGPYFNYSGPPDGESFAGLIAPSSGYSAPVVNRTSVVIEGKSSAIPAFRGEVTGANYSLGQWMYVNDGELYDLSGGPCVDWQVGDPGDPCMMTNVYKQYPAIDKALAKKLKHDWRYGTY